MNVKYSHMLQPTVTHWHDGTKIPGKHSSSHFPLSFSWFRLSLLHHFSHRHPFNWCTVQQGNKLNAQKSPEIIRRFSYAELVKIKWRWVIGDTDGEIKDKEERTSVHVCVCGGMWLCERIDLGAIWTVTSAEPSRRCPWSCLAVR